MNTDNIERYLNSVGKKVVNQSKGNLQRAGKGGKLEESIYFKVVPEGDGFVLQFYMSIYGQYVDKGVSGTKQKRTFKNYKKKVVKSPYAYRNAKGHSQPPSKALDKWVVRKGIAPRGKGGKFASREGIKFAIARSIYKKGIKPSMFFTKPFEAAFKRLPDELVEAYSIGLEKQIQVNINKK